MNGVQERCIDDFIKEHEAHIEQLKKRIEQFRECGLDHWIPVYEQHKKDAEALLKKANELKNK